MSTPSVPNPAPEPVPSNNLTGPGVIAYRIAVVLLLGAIAWNLSRHTESVKAKPAFALPGSIWRLEQELDKKKHVMILEFRTNGTILQRGSGEGKFEIISPDEISVDPGGLFSWPQREVDRWLVVIAGDNLVLRRRSKSDQLFLHRFVASDEERKSQQDLANQHREEIRHQEQMNLLRQIAARK
jgi:hypothetical protein